VDVPCARSKRALRGRERRRGRVGGRRGRVRGGD
jgi:hypothetical protein